MRHLVLKLNHLVRPTIVLGAMVMALSLVPAGTALAAPDAAGHRPPRLTRGMACRREQKRANFDMGRLLHFSDPLAEHVQDLIDQAGAHGFDTSTVASELSLFDAQLTGAATSLEEVQGILEEQTGFDGNCHVLNRHDASQTVHLAGQMLNEFIHSAGKDLKALRHDVQALQRDIH